MPEGDSLYRLAHKLAPALEGQLVTSIELPRSDLPTRHLVGRAITKVTAQGKNLLVYFEEGSVLHVHLRMNGVMHLYPLGPNGAVFRRSRSKAVVILTVPGWTAVCYEAPTVRLLRARDLPVDRRLAALGPDLLGETFDEDEALARLRLRDAQPIGVAVMDQAAVAGIGNVYKSEILFLHRLDPFAPVGAFTDEELRDVLRTARRLLQKNVAPKPFGKDDPFFQAYVGRRVTRPLSEVGKGPVSVYGRLKHACFDCGDVIVMERQGEQQRSTYFCPTCQPRRVFREAAPDGSLRESGPAEALASSSGGEAGRSSSPAASARPSLPARTSDRGPGSRPARTSPRSPGGSRR